MNRRLSALFLLIAAQCLFLLGMSYKHERTLATGDVVLLETQPVDPRDLLRGDYVILSYKISDVPLSSFENSTNPPAPGATVFVRLAPRGEFHEATQAYQTLPEPQPGTVVLRGTVARASADTVRVHYGLEKYFVAEGTGNPTGKLTVEASVGTDGAASIRQVFIDGRPYAEVMSDRRR